MRKSPKKSLWSMGSSFFRPALSPVEWAAHYEGEKLRAREQHRKLTALKRYFSIQRDLRADVPAVLPSQFTPLFGLESADTEHQATLPIWRKKTQPLQEEAQKPAANRYISIRREIFAEADTKPEMRVIEPRLTLKMRRGA